MVCTDDGAVTARIRTPVGPTYSGPDPVNKDLLDILVCPKTHGVLKYDRQTEELISEQAGLAYPIRDGIPVMLEEEARELEP